jgi:hypothetical protein
MKKLIAVVGLLLGLVSGLLLLVFNPLRNDQPVYITAAGDTLLYDFAAIDVQGKEIDAPALLGLGPLLPRSAGFAEEGIENASAAVMALRSESGRPAALATRLAYFRESDSLLMGPLGTEVYWNVFWPNEGSVFLIGYESYWPLIQEQILSLVPNALRFGMEPVSALSVIPKDAETAGVYGSSGSNHSLRGQFIESAINNTGEAEEYTGQLALQISQ